MDLCVLLVCSLVGGLSAKIGARSTAIYGCIGCGPGIGLRNVVHAGKRAQAASGILPAMQAAKLTDEEHEHVGALARAGHVASPPERPARPGTVRPAATPDGCRKSR